MHACRHEVAAAGDLDRVVPAFLEQAQLAAARNGRGIDQYEARAHGLSDRGVTRAVNAKTSVHSSLSNSSRNNRSGMCMTMQWIAPDAPMMPLQFTGTIS